MTPSRFVRFALALPLVGVAGCASTAQLQQVWVDESFDGGLIRAVLVLGVGENEANRRYFETEVSRVFEQRGVKAITGWSVLPSNEEHDEQAVRAAIRGRELDAVMVTAIVDEFERTEVIPEQVTTTLAPEARNIYGDYYRTYRRVHTDRTEITERVFRVETRIYDVRSESLIWSAFYEAGESDTVEKASAPLGRAILNDLVRVDLVE